MKKNIYQNIFLYLTVIFCLSSCVNQKQIAYFQKGINQSDTIQVAKAYIPKIQSVDILSINIGSLNPAASSFFNPYSTTPAGIDFTDATSLANGTTPMPTLSQSASPGFLVAADGSIELPLLGNIKLAGLTTSEARDTIKNRLKHFLKEPTVNVRVMNYKISVMGEVAKPSVYVIPNEKITLPEAISMAGDLTIFGKRDNVLIIRDVDGKKEFGRINLNSREIYNSPYYYLHDNDIVYVEPGKGKSAQSDRIYQILPVLLSALSLITIIVTYSHVKI
ncbi:MAG: Polysaccharide biosynthesis/export protein [Mucilaginibacter sp.]|nr:Polysaccharide biosynthesis/export protein [Mucilaginibacter sp.]